MANEINRLIDMLYEKIEDARSIALQPGMCKVDRDETLDLLEELKAQVPGEIKRAQELLAAREKFIDDAKREAERIVREAEDEAKRKISDSGVAAAAREQANTILNSAEERARQLTQVAAEYAEDALARTEQSIQAALDEVKDSRARFRSVSIAKLQEQRDRLLNQKAAETGEASAE